ncbi:sucrose-6-phosphate hydrolase [Rossellomorea marisflavi]|uniref:sucrose-6-phosphate hydrolase n=1 Tax=Rossellomorea marisflavi TaxID=189381 RepID=UPI00296F06ED|nr:sucrose-6-phosphate hydrolase [Rossellomorea marisflavi]MDW4525827.1 sucrose-6-phosphate hydrolase [Rossellomorea marisflavi]
MNKNEKRLLTAVEERIQSLQQKAEADPYRLNYHLLPPIGLLNDPNGLSFFKGRYHFFYQWNPLEESHGAKFWGHYSSEDLATWRHEPIALVPSEWYERNGCYSGSAVVSDDHLFLFYTGNVKNDASERETYQCLAVSEDGVHFEKKGPIITLPEGFTAHFRDPKVWKRGATWHMVIGAQTSEGAGAVVLYTSDDLYRWNYKGIIAGAGRDALGGYMWECPDLLEFDEGDVLLISPQGIEPEEDRYQNLFQSGYMTGALDVDSSRFSHGDFSELDKGFDFYAPQTMTDEAGRRILVAWMGMTDSQEPYHPTLNYHWIHALTIPRELELKDGVLLQRPVKELKKLRTGAFSVRSKELLAGEKWDFEGMGVESKELIIEVLKVGSFSIHLRNEAEIHYDCQKGRVTLTRRRLDDGSTERRRVDVSRVQKLNLFLDHSSLELFLNDGEHVLTARYFPRVSDDSIIFHSKENVMFSVEAYTLRSNLNVHS